MAFIQNLSSTEIPKSSLIGRDEELRTLAGGLTEAFLGRGWTYSLTGEPGIGKTRLAEEFAALARNRSALVVWGRCSNFEAPPCWPWIQITRAFLDGGEAAGEAVEITRLLSGGVSRTATDRFRLFDRMMNFLRRLATSQPLVLILDDLRAADEASLLLLGFAICELSDVGIQVLLIYRDAEAYLCQPTGQLLRELMLRVTKRISLRRLGRADVRRMIAQDAGGEPPEEIVEAVYRHSGGNPLFIEIMLQHRLLDLQNGGARPIPEVRPALERYLSSLSLVARSLLDMAALSGAEFDFSLIKTASGLDPEQVLDSMAEMELAGVVQRVNAGEQRYCFVHRLIRDALCDSLVGAKRARLHTRIAEALEATYENGADVSLAEIAGHFFAGAALGDTAKALRYSQLAAERASRRLAYGEAARLYKIALGALDLCPAASGVKRERLLLALAASQSKDGNLVEARQNYLRARQLSERSNPVAFSPPSFEVPPLAALSPPSRGAEATEEPRELEIAETRARIGADVSEPAFAESPAARKRRNMGSFSQAGRTVGRPGLTKYPQPQRSASDIRETNLPTQLNETAPGSIAITEQVFRREGEYWTIAYDGKVFRLKHSKGLAYIAQLIAHAGQEFHAADLAASPEDATESGANRANHEFETASSGADPLLDPAAKSSYRQHLRQLRDELEQAVSFGDSERAAKIEDEIAFLSRELAHAIGLGGRDRKLGSETERARLRVTNAIRSAVKKVMRQHPGLGRYLANSLRTGTFCSFEPGAAGSGRWQM